MSHPWCARIASLDPDRFGATLRTFAEEARAGCPELVDVRHAREQDGKMWWLHLAVVLSGDDRRPIEYDLRPLEDTHAGLALRLQRLCERHAGCWAILHRKRPGDALGRYHDPAPGALPLDPPPRAPDPPPPPPKPAPAIVAAPDPPPRPRREPPKQGSLF